MAQHKHVNILPDAFTGLISDGLVTRKTGIISSTLLRDNVVFALVKEEEDHHHNDDGHSFFNVRVYENPSNMTFNEIFIPTDINPVNNNLDLYKGRRVLVSITNGVATFASIYVAPEELTRIPTSVIRKIRDELLVREGTTDIFSRAAEPIWASFGVVQEEIKALKELVFNPDEHTDKTITIEGEASWNKDTNKQQSGELVIPNNPLFRGLNQQGMKTIECHRPTRLFSAK